MATFSSVVIEVTGQVWIRESDGSLTPIQQGMEIPLGAEIVTAEGASVQLQAAGQPSMHIGSDRSVRLTADLVNSQPDVDASAIVPADPEAAAVLAALDAGEDPFDTLDPTAAVLQAGTDGAGGSSFTRLASIIETTSPLALEYPRPTFPTTEEVILGGRGVGGDAEGPVANPPFITIDDLNGVEAGHNS